MITDAEGEDDPPAKKYQYDAYGNILSAPGAFNQNRLTYTARARHVASGLYYYRARFYDPQP
jgi:RHS repeat-associated protein